MWKFIRNVFPANSVTYVNEGKHMFFYVLHIFNSEIFIRCKTVIALNNFGHRSSITQ